MKFLTIHNYNFEKLYREFFAMLNTKGYRDAEYGKYSYEVREFLFFIENKGISDLKEVLAVDIIAYYEYLKERPNQVRGGTLSNSSLSRHLFSLKLFFGFLMDIGELDNSPVDLSSIKIKKAGERSVCSIEEIQQLYKACENRRDIAIMSLAYGCGLRRSEIQKLNVSDVLFHKGILLVREGKYAKSRTVPLSDKVLKDLREYVIYERPKYFQGGSRDTLEAFFVDKRGERMKTFRFNLRLKEIIQRTMNPELIRKEISLHCLRHSIATHLIDNGAKIEFVQKLLGHSGMDTTHIYSKKRRQQLKIMQMMGKE